VTGARDVPDQRGHVADLGRGYLHQVDVVRLLTFGSVIAVHVIAATTVLQSPWGRGWLMLLHFTRETFFVITGFVLFHSVYRKPPSARTFWRRRFLLIGIPYLFWTLIYWWQNIAVGRDHGAVTAGGLRTLAVQTITGTAEYHLYFLLVSMQVYLILPWLVRLVRATTCHHVTLLAASTVAQVAMLSFLHDGVPAWVSRPGWVNAVVPYAEQALPSYLLYVVAGALAAVHIDRVQAWVLGHGRMIGGAIAAGAVLTEGCYLAQLAIGSAPTHASEVLQPVMAAWAPLMTLGLLAVGLRYASTRRPGPASRAVAEGARISFGVFLVHPLVITWLLGTWYGVFASGLGQPWLSIVLWPAVVLISVMAVEVVAYTPLSLPLTGRHRTPLPRRASSSSGPLSSGSAPVDDDPAHAPDRQPAPVPANAGGERPTEPDGRPAIDRSTP
jgi:peptidoglycan/LPS O-acetylase OafA/YrhL